MKNIDRLVSSIIYEFDGDRKRVEHTMKVFAYSRLIGLSENLSAGDQETLETAALLHDIGIPAAIKEYGSAAGPNQEKTGAVISKRILDELHPEIAGAVSHLVGHHHSFNYDGGLLLTILFESDALVNLSEGNMPIESIGTIKQKLFKTALGKTIIEGTYAKELEA